MSRFVNTHALERSIGHLSTSSVLSLDAKRQERHYDQLQELDHQFQIPISGIAVASASWSTVNVPFEVEFFFVPEQRDSPLSMPHFTYGAVVSGIPSPDGTDPDPNNPDALVAVVCQVVEWARDPSKESINGAVLGIGVSTLGSTVEVRFDGHIHLNFQGYGNPLDASTAGDTGSG